MFLKSLRIVNFAVGFLKRLPFLCDWELAIAKAPGLPRAFFVAYNFGLLRSEVHAHGEHNISS